MKHPALFIAVSLALGIFSGPLLAARLPHIALACLASGLIALLMGLSLFGMRRETSAWLLSLLAWALLGASAVLAQPLAIPSHHVNRLLAANQLDLDQPLRWHGRLRADPLRLPWGLRYIVDLSEVESEGQWRPVTGGLRANYYLNERDSHEPAAVRAGDSVELLLRAEPVRNFADPGSFDYRGYLAAQNIHLTGTLRNASLLTQVAGTPPTLVERTARVRGALIRETDGLLAQNPARAAIARAMLLGDRSFLDSDQIEAFQQTGSYHVLILAGLHVGVLVFALLWLCRKLRLPLGPSTFAVIAALAAYVAIVEDRPPILRAALMATAYLLSRLLFRRSDLLNAVGIAALLILIFRPTQLTDASFLLSFLAAATIGGIAAPLLEHTTEPYLRGLDHLNDVTRDGSYAPRVAQFRLDLRSVTQWLTERLPQSISRLGPPAVVGPCRIVLRTVELVLLSLAIQTGLLPLMAQYFHRISVVGPVANLPAVLLTGIIVPYGFATLSLGALWPALGRVLAYGLSTLIGILIATVHWFALPRWASYRVPSPPELLLLAFFLTAVLFATALLASRRWAARVSGAALLSLAALVAAYPFAPRLPAGRMEITVLDVGQGDSIFVAFPNGQTMLVDGGGLPGGFYVRGSRPGLDIGEEVVAPYLWSRGIKKLDAVVLTHAHEDHMGGLPAVLRDFRVAQLWVGRDVDSNGYRRLLAAAQSRGTLIAHHSKGDTYGWGDVRVQILWPPDNNFVKSATNDDSIVLRLEDGKESVLLSGDIERSAEQNLVDGNTQPVTFLKVPHHGSRTSSTDAFLKAFRPSYAAISVGTNNTFGHPNPDTVQRIAAEGAKLYRTDQNGAVTVLLDGRRLDISTFRPTPDRHTAPAVAQADTAP